MLKWLMKFTLEIAPPVAATVIGAFVVHQLWPSSKSDVQPAATPPAAQVTTDAPKPGSAPRVIGTKSIEVPTVEAPATATAGPPGKSARQSSDVAKTVSNPPSQAPRENVFERAEKALAAIPPAKSGSAPSPAEPRAPARATATVPLPPMPPQPPVAPETTAVVAPVTAPPVTAPTTTSTAAVAPMAPPPMDPPREIASPSIAPPPSPPPQVVHRDRSPLRVYHSDRANLADIPMADGDEAPPQEAAAAPPSEQTAPQGPPREKNIVENILGSIHSVLPERLR